jgi:hypothetical protein
MIAALLLILMQPAVEPMPPDHHVFDNEVNGGRALDAAMHCLVWAVPKSKHPPSKAVIAAAHSKCSAQTEKLRRELTQIFAKHPERMRRGLSPNEAANQFVSNLLNRFDYLSSEPVRAEK